MNYNELMQQAQNTMRSTTINQTRLILTQIDTVDNTRLQLVNVKRNHQNATQRLVNAVMVLSGVKWYKFAAVNDAIQHAVDCAIECKNFAVGVAHCEQAYNNAKTVLLNTIITTKRNQQNNGNKQQSNGGK